MDTIEIKLYITVTVPVELDEDGDVLGTSVTDAQDLLTDTIYELADEQGWEVDDIEVK